MRRFFLSPEPVPSTCSTFSRQLGLPALRSLCALFFWASPDFAAASGSDASSGPVDTKPSGSGEPSEALEPLLVISGGVFESFSPVDGVEYRSSSLYLSLDYYVPINRRGTGVIVSGGMQLGELGEDGFWWGPIAGVGIDQVFFKGKALTISVAPQLGYYLSANHLQSDSEGGVELTHGPFVGMGLPFLLPNRTAIVPQVFVNWASDWSNESLVLSPGVVVSFLL